LGVECYVKCTMSLLHLRDPHSIVSKMQILRATIVAREMHKTNDGNADFFRSTFLGMMHVLTTVSHIWRFHMSR